MSDDYYPGQGLLNFLNQPEAPSPAPVPQVSVIYAEPIDNHNNREIIKLKEKIKSLEKENKLLKEEREALKNFAELSVGVPRGRLTAAELVHVLDVMGVVSNPPAEPEHATELMRAFLLRQRALVPRFASTEDS